LANMINEAAINAVKERRDYVCQKDLFDAVEVVLVGKEKKDRIMSREERKIVSYHEVGHALISALQKNSEPVQKITIVPRTMGALGYVMHVPEEEKYLNTEAELRDMLVSLVGGRAAEEVVFDTVTTGAANDIEKATDIARNMVTRYGMSKKFGLMGLATVESQYLEGRTALNCSDATAAQIDAEVVEILKGSYDKALELIRENRGVMDKLAEFLIEKETITGKEFMQIFRREKGLPEPEETESGEAESGGPGQENGTEDRDGEAAKGQEAAAAPVRETAGEKAAAVPGAEPTPEAEADAEKAEESRRNPGLSESAEGDGDARQPEPAARAEAPVEEPQDAAAQESDGNAVPQPRESAPRPEQSAWTGGKEAPEQVSQAEASGNPESDARPVGRFSNGRIE
ncbi:MAG: ATP-dependent metallopeptidase HflB, partial [Lachnospiraceae bacterium]|nr:ATP-dependent metallopeptidase HflB [Lachnospiraceae bacterium]